MAIRIVRFGTPRQPGEGPRLGTVRRPPRGVRKEDWSRRDFFDVWLPELAPSAPAVGWALAEPWTDERWARYARVYRGEMAEPAATHLIATLALLSRTTAILAAVFFLSSLGLTYLGTMHIKAKDPMQQGVMGDVPVTKSVDVPKEVPATVPAPAPAADKAPAAPPSKAGEVPK